MQDMEYFGLTDIGRRSSNQDAYLLKELPSGLLLAVVIDGCGEAGDVAGIVAEQLADGYYAKRDDMTIEKMSESLKANVTTVNNYIIEYRRYAPCCGNCCLTAALVNPSGNGTAIAIAHVGDTRGYVYTDGTLAKITRDHSPIGRLLDCGAFTEEEACKHPLRHRIDRALGVNLLTHGSNYIYTNSMVCNPRDTLMLCTDGVYDPLLLCDIKSVLDTNDSIEVKSNRLIRMAQEGGSTDNATIIIVNL